MTVAAVVLAAGEGSRYEGETHKLLADFRGRPLVLWAIDGAMQSGADQVYLIIGAVDLVTELGTALPDDLVVVDNELWEQGQATSLRTAVAVAQADGHEAIVVGLGDMPLVPVAAWQAVAETEGELVTATFRGQRRPPVKISADMWPLLPLSGDEGARSLLRMRPDAVREVTCAGEAIDIDTRGDLRRWT